MVTKLDRFTIRGGKYCIELNVKYTLYESGSLLLRYEDQFKELTIHETNIPQVFLITCGNSKCFCFAHNGTIYSSYHVTQGRNLVLPLLLTNGRCKKNIYTSW